MRVVGEADNGRDAVTKALHLQPDVCLLDIRMPELNGIEATREILRAENGTDIKVVIITTFDLDEYVYEALQAGAIGFLLKNAGPELLIEAVRAASDGESLISPAITSRLLDHLAVPKSVGSSAGGANLTDREEEVLAATARGATNAEIGEELHISISTVKAHLSALMNKLEARNRVELVIWAYHNGRIG